MGEEEEEEDQFSLADQIRATPERSLKKEKKKKNRRSTDSEATSVDSGRMEEDEIPPPLPPKRITPSPKKGLSLETQPSLDEEEEAVPVKNSQDEQPQAPRREKQSQPREMTEKATPDPVQSRPLPNPPAPPRLKKNKSVDSEGRSSRASGTGSPSCYRDAADATYTETANFQSCKDTLHTNASKTLVDSANRPHSSLSDVTLADSCVDSLVSCAETLVGDSDPNLETCAETLRDEDQTEFFSDDDLDNPYPAVDFDQMMAQGPGAGAQIIDRPGRSSVKKSESGRRLQEGTEQRSTTCLPAWEPDLVLAHTASLATQASTVPRNSEGGARGARLEQGVKDDLVCTVYIQTPPMIEFYFIVIFQNFTNEKTIGNQKKKKKKKKKK